MKLHRIKEGLRERLPLSWKLALKRLGFGPVGGAVRLAARTRAAADRVLAGAATHGLDLHRARGARADAPPPLRTALRRARLSLPDERGLRPRGRAAFARPARPRFHHHPRPRQGRVHLPMPALARARDRLRRAEVIVVNNASRDETGQLLSHFGDFVRVIDNDVNRGFVDACNQGAAVARGRHLVFLNNDTAVLPGWLDALLETVEGDETAGAVGPMFLYPDWRIQEAGGIVWRDGAAFHYGWGKSPDDRRFNFAREVDYCSGASLLVRKEFVRPPRRLRPPLRAGLLRRRRPLLRRALARLQGRLPTRLAPHPLRRRDRRDGHRQRLQALPARQPAEVLRQVARRA